MARLALQAGSWYNSTIKYGCLSDVDSILSREHNLVGGYAMDILSPDSPESKPSEKRCTSCKNFFPATPEFFHRDKRGKYGLWSKCKVCRSKPRDVLEGYKRCTACKHVFPATIEFFSHDKEGKCGLKAKCKACLNKVAGIYRACPETKEQRHAYHTSHFRQPEVRARHLAQVKRYQSKPAVYEKLLNNVRNRNIRKKAVKGSHTAEQIQDLLKRQKCKCYYCSTRFKRAKGKYIYHIDHTFPISRVVGTDIPANDISYLVLTCPTCNLSKHDKYPWEFPEGGKLL